ncbi:hypothetical protein Fmac_025585 [Flemingia macrophylla]|uniref:Uncharacterized protein n=1 Tax=Flemingia macrophylla TaxID=520843 RepID=A0ABD1LSM9_9FABA
MTMHIINEHMSPFQAFCTLAKISSKELDTRLVLTRADSLFHISKENSQVKNTCCCVSWLFRQILQMEAIHIPSCMHLSSVETRSHNAFQRNPERAGGNQEFQINLPQKGFGPVDMRDNK